MKVIIFILILASFLQATIVPINLVLLILIIRTYIKPEKENLILSFAFGLLISLLEHAPLGLHSVIYLGFTEVTYLFSKAPIARNFITAVPFTLVILTLSSILISVILGFSIQLFPQIIIEGIITAPIYFILRIWEERFVVRREVKLKV